VPGHRLITANGGSHGKPEPLHVERVARGAHRFDAGEHRGTPADRVQTLRHRGHERDERRFSSTSSIRLQPGLERGVGLVRFRPLRGAVFYL
jgi:hypothetical protein